MGKVVSLFLVSVLIFSCSSSKKIQPFASDGCSLFPDSDLITSVDWCDCCFDHDVVYWRGGTEQQRKAADIQLKECVFQKTQNKALASAMYNGVRFGGSPYFYNWYRWGYGWSYDRKYQPLSSDEEGAADKLLSKYYQEQKGSACPVESHQP